MNKLEHFFLNLKYYYLLFFFLLAAYVGIKELLRKDYHFILESSNYDSIELQIYTDSKYYGRKSYDIVNKKIIDSFIYFLNFNEPRSFNPRLRKFNLELELKTKNNKNIDIDLYITDFNDIGFFKYDIINSKRGKSSQYVINDINDSFKSFLYRHYLGSITEFK